MAARGAIIPPLFNAHTHLLDATLRPGARRFRGRVEELVRPPGGWKHRMLRETPPEALAAGVRRALRAMARSGTGGSLDFVEMGMRGLDVIHSAIQIPKNALTMILLGRPVNLEYERKEVDAILDRAHGLGLSAMRDWPADELEKVARRCVRRRKFLAIHASEAVREPLGPILDLKPSLLVHLLKATDSEYRAVAERSIPVAVCPRAYRFNRLALPLGRMLDAGVEVIPGTDNAMISSPSVIGELRELRRTWGARADTGKLWRMVVRGWKLLNRYRPIIPAPGAPDGFAVVRVPHPETAGPRDVVRAMLARGVRSLAAVAPGGPLERRL